MSLDQTQQAINRYFDVMGLGGDFAECYTADVTWTTTDTREEVRGASSVHDYVVALHNNMFDAQTRSIVLSDGHTYLEGDCPRRPPEPVAGSSTASHTTSSRTELPPCAATVRSLLSLPSF